METSFLLKTIQSPLGKAEVEKLAETIIKEDFSIAELIMLSLHKEEQVGFRAAWILERIYSNQQDRFIPYIDLFFEKIKIQNNLSARRHYAKILAFMTNKKASSCIKQIIDKTDTDELVELIFNWLIDEKVPVAVKSHCLSILADLNRKHDWIKDELLQTMDFLVDRESIAFYAKMKQIRKQLGFKNRVNIGR